jgi:hypothetical protein
MVYETGDEGIIVVNGYASATITPTSSINGQVGGKFINSYHTGSSIVIGLPVS